MVVFLYETADNTVDLFNDLLQLNVDVIEIHHEFIDKSINLVKNENHFDFISIGLFNNSVSLTRYSFQNINQYQCTIGQHQCSLNFTTELNVSWTINQVN